MKRVIIEIDKNGNPVIPQQIKEHFLLIPGGKILLEVDEDRFVLSRPTNGLHRVYLEVTNHCNLDCSMCIRKIWGNEKGNMSIDQFQKIMSDIKLFHPIPEVFFSGYGEPLNHPNIIEMIRCAKMTGAKTTLITNGILLTQEMSDALISSYLDMLWVSIDGAEPNSYQDIRLGNHLPQIIRNLDNFQIIRSKYFGRSLWAGRPQLGIVFVLMNRNLTELPPVIELGKNLALPITM